MKREQFELLVAEWYAEGTELMTKKGDDYASEADILGDFRRLSMLCKILDVRPAERAEDTARFFMLVKLDRDANLIGKVAKNESRRDTLMDFQNYLSLYRALLEEKGGICLS